jgi:hypothetical protein
MRCGQRAALALQDLIGRRTVTCDERDVDRYGRIVGRCLVGGLDINEWLRAWRWRTGAIPVTTWPQRTRFALPAAGCGPAPSSRRGSGGVDSGDAPMHGQRMGAGVARVLNLSRPQFVSAEPARDHLIKVGFRKHAVSAFALVSERYSSEFLRASVHPPIRFGRARHRPRDHEVSGSLSDTTPAGCQRPHRSAIWA